MVASGCPHVRHQTQAIIRHIRAPQNLPSTIWDVPVLMIPQRFPSVVRNRSDSPDEMLPVQSSHGQQEGPAGREPLVEPHCRGRVSPLWGGGHPIPTVPATEAQDTRVPWEDRGSTCLRAQTVCLMSWVSEGRLGRLMGLGSGLCVSKIFIQEVFAFWCVLRLPTVHSL